MSQRIFGLLALLAFTAGAAAGCIRRERAPDSRPPPQLTVQATDSPAGSFVLRVPRSIESGVVTVRLVNRGSVPRRAQLIRVAGRRSAQEVAAAMRTILDEGPAPDWLSPAGGVGATPPGSTRTSVQEMSPGSYFAVDTGRAGDEEGARYFERGAIAGFRISGTGGTRAAARTPTVVAAYEYGFRPLRLRAGRNLLRFENSGREPHQLLAAPIAGGATIADVRRAFRRGRRAPLDRQAAQETAVLEGGRGQVTEIELREGRYALLCFASDRAGGPPHVANGMISHAIVR